MELILVSVVFGLVIYFIMEEEVMIELEELATELTIKSNSFCKLMEKLSHVEVEEVEDTFDYRDYSN